MYTNYITDSWFVLPKSVCLFYSSFPFFSFSFFFYRILYIPPHPLSSASASTHFYYLGEEETQEKERKKGEGKNLRHNPYLMFSIPFPSSQGNDTSPVEEGNVLNTCSRSNKTSKSSSSFQFFFPVYCYYFSVIFVVYKLQ